MLIQASTTRQIALKVAIIQAVSLGLLFLAERYDEHFFYEGSLLTPLATAEGLLSSVLSIGTATAIELLQCMLANKLR